MENTTTTNINDINNTIEALDKLDPRTTWLSPHFRLIEFTRSGVATDKGIDNTPRQGGGGRAARALREHTRTPAPSLRRHIHLLGLSLPPAQQRRGRRDELAAHAWRGRRHLALHLRRLARRREVRQGARLRPGARGAAPRLQGAMAPRELYHAPSQPPLPERGRARHGGARAVRKTPGKTCHSELFFLSLP